MDRFYMVEGKDIPEEATRFPGDRIFHSQRTPALAKAISFPAEMQIKCVWRGMSRTGPK